MKRRAVFLDRDGTINVDVGYPRDFSQITIYPASFEAIRRVNASGLLAIVITNQSGVGRGFFSEADLALLHERLTSALAAGGARLDAIFACPHYEFAPDPRYGGDCACRKPKPGLALRAAEAFGIALDSSYMIGDKAEDIEFGLGIKALPVLVRTGYGEKGALPQLAARGLAPAHVADGVLEAVDWILERERSARR